MAKSKRRHNLLSERVAIRYDERNESENGWFLCLREKGECDEGFVRKAKTPGSLVFCEFVCIRFAGRMRRQKRAVGQQPAMPVKRAMRIW
jgi:hypothetical protein